jgi:NADH-quinone oxidoreductase subunit M
MKDLSELHVPWLELAILVPMLGGLIVSFIRDAGSARRWSLVFTAFTFLMTAGEYIDFQSVQAHEADDPGHLFSQLFGREVFVVDEISAPLLAVSSMLFVLTTAATTRSKIRRFSFAWMLFSESLMLATFSCKTTWLIIALLAARTVRPYIELRARGRPTGVYVFHMTCYVGCLVIGQLLVDRENALAGGEAHAHSLWAILPLLIAVLIRSGIAPFHCWITDLFEHTTFGTALLYTAPLSGAYVAVRILLPAANDDALHWMGVLSLITAVYAGGMALVQREGRRFFCYLFLSHSALVLVGLEMVTPVGLTGGLSLWLSLGLSLGGFGLTLRALEARRGRLALNSFQGLYEHAPALAICFALTGLASVGFPGTMGFVGAELLVDGAVELYSPLVGATVVIAAALNGIAIVRAYFLLFTGTRYVSNISLLASRREKFAVFCLAALLIAGGLVPQYNVAARFEAADKVLKDRKRDKLTDEQPLNLLLGTEEPEAGEQEAAAAEVD